MTLRSPRQAFALAVALVLAAGCGGSGGSRRLRNGLTPGSVDLTVDAEQVAASLAVGDEFFADDHCAVVEGALPAGGIRRLLRFDTVIENRGELDLVVGDPADPEPPLLPGDFEPSPCHDHFHFTGFAEYELRDSTGAVAGFGHKQAFCLVDSLLRVPGSASRGFDCEFQGISSGWADLYDRTLDGQWVDVTGLPAGDYTLVITVDASGDFEEGLDLQPNVASIPVTLPAP